MKKAFAIRFRVFVREQGVPAAIELDRYDGRAIHLLAFVEGKAVGTARVVAHQNRVKIGRMAVLKTYRAQGIGRELLRKAITFARRVRANEICLNAQVPVIGFYERAGFRAVGPVFKEAGIPHRKMVLRSRKNPQRAKH